jgi:cytochrome P450
LTVAPSRGGAFDPFDPATRACPYAAYRRLREHAPVAYHPGAGIWFVTGHREAVAVLRDERFSATGGQQLRGRADALPVTMLSSDPPEHTRLRVAISAEFGRARVERLAAEIRDTAVERVAAWPRPGTVDAVRELAVPVAADALARLLGIPRVDVDRFQAWAIEVAPQLDPLDPLESGSGAAVALAEMLDWFASLLAQRLGAPSDDVLGALVRAFERSALSGDEARNACGLLVIGGFEPLADTIATALWLLLRDGVAVPKQQPDVAAAIEEALRYESPIHFAARVPVEDVELDAARLSAGDPVVVLLGATNRDPDRFAEPDRFEPDRRPNPHLAFGAGIHSCLGAAFARLVARIAVSAVIDRAPAARVTREPRWRDSFVPRGLAALELDVAA